MVISENEAQFRETEKILKGAYMFVSQDTDVPLDRNPMGRWKGWPPAPYGLLILTNERLLFLFEERASTTGELVVAGLKGAAKGAALGAIEGFLSVITLGLSELIGMLLGLKGSSGIKVRKKSVDFSLFKDSESSFAIDIQNIKGYIHKSASFGSYLKLNRRFEEVYLTLHTQDIEGNAKDYCLYSNRIGDKKFFNHMKWLKILKKYNKNL